MAKSLALLYLCILSYFSTADLFLKRRLLKMAKSPVMQTGGSNNSKSRYGNALKFVMAFLDM